MRLVKISNHFSCFSFKCAQKKRKKTNEHRVKKYSRVTFFRDLKIFFKVFWGGFFRWFSSVFFCMSHGRQPWHMAWLDIIHITHKKWINERRHTKTTIQRKGEKWRWTDEKHTETWGEGGGGGGDGGWLREKCEYEQKRQPKIWQNRREMLWGWQCEMDFFCLLFFFAILENLANFKKRLHTQRDRVERRSEGRIRIRFHFFLCYFLHI